MKVHFLAAERCAREVFTVHHDKYALSVHPWREPDSLAADIAARYAICLLDAPMGTIVRFTQTKEAE